MEENPLSTILDGEIVGIKFGLASRQEICTASISDAPISHASQLTNPFLGLPLQFGKCESCGTSEPGKCEGHFGYIELPIPIYHPSHISELKRMLSLLCLKCLKMRKNKVPLKTGGIAERLLSSCCEGSPQVSVKEVKTTDGAFYLELKLPSRSRPQDGFWNFLERYGFHYGDGSTRTLLPCEVMEILKRIPQETRKRLAGKGYFPQDGYVIHYLPVPPNCLSVPEVSDGVSVMSSDLSISMLKKVIKQVEIIKSSRSGTPNFESHEVEANDLQSAVDQYLQVRGTSRGSRDVDTRFGVKKESSTSSTKAWLEKMRTLFIRKGSGFSSRSVITGDAYKGVNEIGIPLEIAQRITFEERVNMHNMKYLQDLVDNKLCLTYRDGSSTYSLREGSKGHTFLRPGQVVHRRIMDGDTVFINRPPTTHKHSLQALAVYVHHDHTVKINPLICGPLSADFDGDCVHLFYPQSLAAKAEVLELFSVEKQLCSSHSGNLNLQLATDSLLSLKLMFKTNLLKRAAAEQLAMFVSLSLPRPALLKAHSCGPCWTALQLLQTVMPSEFDCEGDNYMISKSEILVADFNREVVQSVMNEIVTSIFFEKGPAAVLRFFNWLQPLLMESLFGEGFSVSLEDFYISKASLEYIHQDINVISPLLGRLRSTYNERVELQLENHIRLTKDPVAHFILKSSALGDLIDSKSDSSVNKVVQQIGFLGLQLSDKGKFYSKTLFEDVGSHFESKYPSHIVDYPSVKYGLVKGCFFHGLDPYEEMIHSISTREVIVRSSRGLSEPGTLFKNLMAILRDVVICYDGTVRNVSSNSIIQFEYGVNTGTRSQSLFPPGEPVGVLAATAMSNPAYKAVLDSTPSSNSSWEQMKEILLCRVNFKNDLTDRRAILYLNDCDCGRKYCRENAAFFIKNQLKKVSLKDTTIEFMIEYKQQQSVSESIDTDAGIVGHVHLNKMLLKELNITMQDILQKCLETVKSFRKKKKVATLFKDTHLSVSECCSFHQFGAEKSSDMPCLMFFWHERNEIHLERTSHYLADIIYPVLLETIVKGDPRISSVTIIWVSPDSTTWIRNPSQVRKGELALDVVLEKSVVKQSGDAWRVLLDSCLPVLHLIDTTRSIPSAIKEVQELLGISCAFSQAVQRLATSVKMVAKGILKEHLILLANSMTCAGNLIGFNSGGYKALLRSFNIQVPFTEATHFTPRKCFERAAEKCHVDTLASIVASCSWGKHVSLGTGSRFDILWDTREAKLNQQGKTDVYNFLHMVRSADREEPTTACLGADIDDLELDGENVDWIASPVHNSGVDKPVFEDSDEFQTALSGWDSEKAGTQGFLSVKPQDESAMISGWDAAAASGSKSHNCDDSWNVGVSTEKSNSWSGWGSDKAEKQDSLSTKPRDGHESSRVSHDATAWGSKSPNGDNSWNVVVSTEKSNAWSGWGSDKAEKQGSFSTKPQDEQESSSGWDAATGSASKSEEGGRAANVWKTSSISNAGFSWGSKKTDKQDILSTKAPEESSNSWDSAAAWGSKSEQGDRSGKFGTSILKSNVWSGEPHSAKAIEEHEKSSGWDATVGWGSKSEQGDRSKNAGTNISQTNAWSGWESERPDKQDTLSNNGQESVRFSGCDDTAVWGTKSSAWGAQKSEKQDVVSLKVQGDSSRSSDWNSVAAWGSKPVDKCDPGVSISDGQDLLDQGRELSSWDNKVNQDYTPSGWPPSKDELPTQQVLEEESPVVNSSWGQLKSPETSHGWGSSNEANRPASSQGWGLPNTGDGNETKRNRQWGEQGREPFKKNQFEGSRGWGANAADWKNKTNRPPKSPGMLKDDSNIPRLYTTTRQRLDIFTSEEQDILSNVEPLMHSIRRIMHLSGYNDGDPLSADDQSFVLDNVFNYHPDKAVKMGAGVDHVTVSRHTSFQESRCFHIVSTDGLKQDFSYRKCLDNYIKGKYPNLAEEFIAKYFRKPHNDRKWEREETGNEITQ
ncbi:RNA_pol_Rpb1_2 domain-containing protein/RNA_pol_Rpb1_3 domain-containing protein/RNA_pol_Rpb1_1 domain-containing protein/RNA_pol_Rpb1_5 domain-containing protein/DUF3223 domain-containing protein [Cephalotus follicularis]|uniref:DNA-directed RNA polymerase subunit n=1 Tax=Cephalotus follicularis TaxID=3775 RepID=A0A1Q3C4U9_CEPFO|nr:RNA_pol_Rpb1_2 domain-containing protein/RNA_pol_Rpb1_3 domain-containing protein/RNA_pol_Rpb1_1 domain-containing protein/RNA_pol_Rpb1_5 domain-containing protein/DUF3223 domain-containing protein [Cephalotus follicularis]